MSDLLHVDLCCGLGGWQAPFRESERWSSVGLDVRRDLDPDVVADVRELPLSACEPTLVTASPPCTEYSSAWNAVRAPVHRYPDFTTWNACVKAMADLRPTWCVLENVAQAQHWHGPSHKHVGPYHLWGHFPPFDVRGDFRKREKSDRHWTEIQDLTSSIEAQTIPYPLADALRQSVEVWT